MAHQRIRKWVRSLLFLALGSALAWITFGVTVDRALGNKAPEIALSIWPQGIVGNVASVAKQLKAGQLGSQDIAAVRSAMRTALQREPANSGAVASYAALGDLTSDADSARSFFRLAEALSRRNLLTQSWLIEDAVRRGDIAGAIVHYNRAMTVSEDLRQQFIPILVKATTERDVRTALWPVLAKNPLWRDAFLTELGAQGESPQALDGASRFARLNILAPSDAGLVQNILKRLLTLKAYDRATALAQHLEGRQSQERSLQDGNFDSGEGIIPFGWWLSDGSEVRAFRESVPTGGIGLRVEVNGGTAGSVAQQLIGLPKGDYVLRGMAGDVTAEQGASPQIGIACPDGKLLAKYTVLPSGPEGRRFAFDFQIPATACSVQWINISASSEIATAFWIDSLSIAPARMRAN